MRIELLIAQTILQGFDAQYGRFLEVTSGAQHRFEQADWVAVQTAMKQRIHLYDHHVGLVVTNSNVSPALISMTQPFWQRLNAPTASCYLITQELKLPKVFLILSTAVFLNIVI